MKVLEGQPSPSLAADDGDLRHAAAQWGKGDHRGNELLPDGAQPCCPTVTGVDTQEVVKRVRLVDKALEHVDRFRSCDGAYLHWTGYFMYGS